jgi:predicted transcriptional regulator
MVDDKDNVQSTSKYKQIYTDSVKMGILKILQEDGACSLGHIIQKMKMSNITGPEHILELRNIGLVKKTGNPPMFQLNKEKYQEFLKHFTTKQR